MQRRITSADDDFLRHRHALKHPVVDELDADRSVALIEEDPRRRRVQHYVQIRPIPGGTEKSASRRQPWAVSGRGLRYGESRVRPSVQIDRVVS